MARREADVFVATIVLVLLLAFVTGGGALGKLVGLRSQLATAASSDCLTRDRRRGSGQIPAEIRHMPTLSARLRRTLNP